MNVFYAEKAEFLLPVTVEIVKPVSLPTEGKDTFLKIHIILFVKISYCFF